MAPGSHLARSPWPDPVSASVPVCAYELRSGPPDTATIEQIAQAIPGLPNRMWRASTA
jgi:hypothetical protein